MRESNPLDGASSRGVPARATPIVVPPDQPICLVGEDGSLLSAAGDAEFIG